MIRLKKADTGDRDVSGQAGIGEGAAPLGEQIALIADRPESGRGSKRGR